MEIIGEGTVNRGKKGDKHTKTRWQYQASSGVLRAILPQVIPFLIIKRKTAEKMLEYFDLIHDKNSIHAGRSVPPGYYERIDSLYFAIKKLNEKGKPKLASNNNIIIT